MNFLLVCSCGKRWMSSDDLDSRAAVCPSCGQTLAAIRPTGWRTLWPRLAVTAAVTLLAVSAVGMALVLLLPAPQRETVPEATTITPNPQTETVIHKPLIPAAETPSSPLDDSPASGSRQLLPLLDKSPRIAFPLDNPPPPRAIKPSDLKPRETSPRSIRELPPLGEFFQHLVISRVSRYRILELDLGQDVQYVLVSRFRIKKKNDDGGMVVEQKVESVRLTNADPALQVRLNELLQKTKGATFTMTLNARREVTKFEGRQEALKVLTGDNPLGGPSFLLWSFLDRDGWKELAQLSFFQPPRSIRRGERWERPMTHSWGPLGSWSGKIYFQATGKQAGFDRFDYMLHLGYQPPRKSGGLPFEIGKSQFQIQTAHGAIAYEPSRERIVAAEERFHVRGDLAVSFLGTESSVQMDEMQLFQIRIVDKNPLEP